MDERLEAWLAAEAEDIDALWRRLLRRPLEQHERKATAARLAEGMSRATLAAELVDSDEFRRVRLLDDAAAWALAQRRAGERPRGLTAPAGTDERAIEIPWCLARCTGARVLDVGFAFAEPAYVAGLLALDGAKVTGVDLVEADVPGLTSIRSDVRSLPFRADAFDVGVALSTLEHVGRDNTQYGLATEDDDGALDEALRELRRVTRRLLVTVPTGERELRPEQAVLEPDAWIERFERAGFTVWEDELYELQPDGWRSVTALTPGLRYGALGPGASAVLCAELTPTSVAGRLRLAVRDRRHSDEVRRVTG